MKWLWAFPFLRPWLFRQWERRERTVLETHRSEGSAGEALRPGREAIPFSLPDDTGRRRFSSEWIGRSPVLLWMTNLCEVCADQAVELVAARHTGTLASDVVAIHFPGTMSPLPADFRRRTGAGFPILMDDGSVTRAWSGDALPDT